MKINTALILGAGFGKRLRPLTLNNPKPLLKINDTTLLEGCIKLIQNLDIKKIIINTFYLKNKIVEFVNEKNFDLDIKVVDDGENILDTGGGILNMIKSSNDNDFLIFNPDTLWNSKYIDEIEKMKKFYFLNKIKNILLLVNNNLSFDKKFKGDFNLLKNKIKKDYKNDFTYIGCQIINKDLFKSYTIKSFSISEIWNKLLKTNELYGYESLENFFHLSDLEVYKKLLKN
mgnify:FL=1